MDVRINGRIPKLGTVEVDAHFVPKIKSTKPIFPIAGIPDTTRYKQISATNTILR